MGAQQSTFILGKTRRAIFAQHEPVFEQILDSDLPDKYGELKYTTQSGKSFTKAVVLLLSNLLIVCIENKAGSCFKVAKILDLSDPMCRYTGCRVFNAPNKCIRWKLEVKVQHVSKSSKKNNSIDFLSDNTVTSDPHETGWGWIAAIRNRMDDCKKMHSIPLSVVNIRRRNRKLPKVSVFRKSGQEKQSMNSVKNNNDQVTCVTDYMFKALSGPSISGRVRNPVQSLQEERVVQFQEYISPLQVRETERTQDSILDLLKTHNWSFEEARRAVQRETRLVDFDEDCASMECGVCFQTMTTSSLMALSCDHFFCLECWKTFLRVRVCEGIICLHTTCMHLKCPTPVPPSWFKQLLSEQEYLRFEQLERRRFVDSASELKWCSRPACEGVLRSTQVSTCGEAIGTCTPVLCSSCDTTMCFNCTQPAHEPASCAQVEVWWAAKDIALEASKVEEVVHEAQGRARAKAWILKHTKPCPGCKAPIQKSEGCNHMTCPGCSFEFCWECYEEWFNHGIETVNYFRCSNVTRRKAMQEIKAKEMSLRQEALAEFKELSESARKERSAFREQDTEYRRAKEFVRRFEQYDKLVRKCEERIEPVVSNGLEVIKRQFDDKLARKLHSFLHECNNTLKWSYVVSYCWSTPGARELNWVSHPQVLDPSSASVLAIDAVESSPIPGPHRDALALLQARLKHQLQRIREMIVASGWSQQYTNASCESPARQDKWIKFRARLLFIVRKATRSLSALKCVARSLAFFGDQKSVLAPNANAVAWLCSTCGTTNSGCQDCRTCSLPVILNMFARYRCFVQRNLYECYHCGEGPSTPFGTKAPCCSASEDEGQSESLVCRDCGAHLLQSVDAVDEALRPIEGSDGAAVPEVTEHDLEVMSVAEWLDLPDTNSEPSAAGAPAARSENAGGEMTIAQHEILDACMTSVGERNFAGITCPTGHDAKLVNLNSVTTCTFCNDEVDSPLFVCSECDWQLCESCAIQAGVDDNNPDSGEDGCSFSSFEEKGEDSPSSSASDTNVTIVGNTSCQVSCVLQEEMQVEGTGGPIRSNIPDVDSTDASARDSGTASINVWQKLTPVERYSQSAIDNPLYESPRTTQNQSRPTLLLENGWECQEADTPIVESGTNSYTSCFSTKSISHDFGCKMQHFGLCLLKPTKSNTNSTKTLPVIVQAGEIGQDLNFELWWETVSPNDISSWVGHLLAKAVLVAGVEMSVSQEDDNASEPTLHSDDLSETGELEGSSQSRFVNISLPCETPLADIGSANLSVPVTDITKRLRDICQKLWIKAKDENAVDFKVRLISLHIRIELKVVVSEDLLLSIPQLRHHAFMVKTDEIQVQVASPS